MELYGSKNISVTNCHADVLNGSLSVDKTMETGEGGRTLKLTDLESVAVPVEPLPW